MDDFSLCFDFLGAQNLVVSAGKNMNIGKNLRLQNF